MSQMNVTADFLSKTAQYIANANQQLEKSATEKRAFAPVSSTP